MTLRLYNTLTREKEEFKPIKKGRVGLYTCGPTVYNYAHIGNLRTYVFEDILKRVFFYNKFKVKQVMNITDVGHLTSDADEGEDKLELSAKKEGKTPEQIADFYTKAFKKDIDLLNILEPEVWCKATKHIKDMIHLIKKIEKNGYAYVAGGNVYFDTSKFKNYGELAKLKLEDLKAGARTEVDKSKKHPRDFVLWFTESKFKGHLQNWDSPWGKGFPGWHIECSAMSSKYLGEQFDIHTGGIDHIPVHHTNELAQAEAGFKKKPWVKYWIHGEFLVMDKAKMAKSAGTFIALQTVLDKGFNPLAYRYLCLGTHYRKQLMFSWEAMTGAQNAYKALKNRIAELKRQDTSLNKENKKEFYERVFLERINDDMNMPQALALVNDTLGEASLGSKEKIGLIKDFDKILALDLLKEEKIDIPKEVKELVDKREEARKKKDFKTADTIRKTITSKGFIIEDTSKGPRIKKK